MFATIHLDGAHMVRPRLDQVPLGNHGWAGGTQKARDWRLGLDYLYFIHEKPEGMYFLAGLSLHHWDLEQREQDLPGGTERVTHKTSTQAGFGLGFGWQHTREVGTEIQFVQSRSSTLPLDQRSVRYWLGTLTYRF